MRRRLRSPCAKRASRFDVALPDGMGAGGAGGGLRQAANPRAEVPALIDGETTVFDSTIILEYIEDRWPTPALLPSLTRRPGAGADDRRGDGHPLRGRELGHGRAQLVSPRGRRPRHDADQRRRRGRRGAFSTGWRRNSAPARGLTARLSAGATCRSSPYVGTAIGVGNRPTEELEDWPAWFDRAMTRDSVATTIAESRAFSMPSSGSVRSGKGRGPVQTRISRPPPGMDDQVRRHRRGARRP